SDRYGRRRVMVLALSVFALASIALILTPNITYFIVLRALQGLFGAAGGALGRAIAVDLSEGTTAVGALALVATVIGLVPLIAPPVGALIAHIYVWRGVLPVLGGIAVLVWIFALVAVPVSLPPHQRASGPLRNAYRPLFRILANPLFVLSTISFS